MRLDLIGILVTLASVAGCQDSPQPLPSSSTSREWASALAHLPLDPRQASRTLQAYVAANGLRLPFWIRDSADSGRRAAFEVHEHPCGEAASAFVSRVPAANHPVLVTETAVEIASSGQALRTWRLPIDRRVLAIRGSELIVDIATGDTRRHLALGIDTAGSFRILEEPRASPDTVPCPSVRPFRGSDYLQCLRLRDLRTRAPRTIAYQSPCT